MTDIINQNTFTTALGAFDRQKFASLTRLRANALLALRESLRAKDFTEVTTASLVNVAGSCENPHASFTLNYYGRQAHLSQSAQLQLEALVMRLKRGFFTVNNSFREENFDDPESKGRRLSEFTLIEPERPFANLDANKALESIISQLEDIIRKVTLRLLHDNEQDIILLGGDPNFLRLTLKKPFARLTYNEALKLLHQKGFSLTFGDDMGIKEERAILKRFNNMPVFITHHPASIKFFNMKKTPDEKKVFSFDLLLPQLGETVGGAVREEDGEKIKKQLLGSKVGKFLIQNKTDPLETFNEYLNLFKQEQPTLRGGFGIGFERFVAFLINSNDILNTIADTSHLPK